MISLESSRTRLAALEMELMRMEAEGCETCFMEPNVEEAEAGLQVCTAEGLRQAILWHKHRMPAPDLA